MKATIEFDDALYRQLKAVAALRGRKVKDLVTEGVRLMLDEPGAAAPSEPAPHPPAPVPAWFGSLRKYAVNAHGRHDMGAIRRSIAKGRRGGGE
jgi:hypothetical protein